MVNQPLMRPLGRNRLASSWWRPDIPLPTCEDAVHDILHASLRTPGKKIWIKMRGYAEENGLSLLKSSRNGLALPGIMLHSVIENTKELQTGVLTELNLLPQNFREIDVPEDARYQNANKLLCCDSSRTGTLPQRPDELKARAEIRTKYDPGNQWVTSITSAVVWKFHQVRASDIMVGPGQGSAKVPRNCCFLPHMSTAGPMRCKLLFSDFLKTGTVHT